MITVKIEYNNDFQRWEFVTDGESGTYLTDKMIEDRNYFERFRDKFFKRLLTLAREKK